MSPLYRGQSWLNEQTRDSLNRRTQAEPPPERAPKRVSRPVAKPTAPEPTDPPKRRWWTDLDYPNQYAQQKASDHDHH